MLPILIRKSWIIGLFLILSAGLLLYFSSPKLENLKIEQILPSGELSLAENDSLVFDSNNGIKYSSQRLPYYQNQPKGKYKLSFELETNFFSQKTFRTFADDCLISLKINNQDLSNTKLGCDRKDQNITYSQLKQGKNNIIIEIENYGGSLAFMLNYSLYDSLFLGIVILFSLGLFSLIWGVLENLLKNRSGQTELILVLSCFLMLGSFLVRFSYLMQTEFHERTYDLLATGHFGYLEYLFQEKTLPKADTGWQYYSPPLYYYFGSQILTFVRALNFLAPQFFLQLFSLVIFIFIDLIVLFIFHDYFDFDTKRKQEDLKSNTKNDSKYYLEKNQRFSLFSLFNNLKYIPSKHWLLLFSFSIWAFWPGIILHSTRISNDILYYLFAISGFYFLIKWLKEKKLFNKWLFLLAISLGFGLISKTNILINIAFTGLVILIHLILKSKDFYFQIQKSLASQKLAMLKGTIAKSEKSSLSTFPSSQNWQTAIFFIQKALFLGLTFFIILLPFAGLNFYRNYIIWEQNPDYGLVVSNINGLNPALSVKNNFYNFICFQPETFLSGKYANPFDDLGGRQCFWNFFLRTSQVGEFSYPNSKSTIFLQVLSFLLICFVLIIFYRIFTQKWWWWKQNWLYISFGILNLSSLIFYRQRHSFSPNGDFRFILPIIISLPILYFSFKNPLTQIKITNLRQLVYFLIPVFLLISGVLFYLHIIP